MPRDNDLFTGIKQPNETLERLLHSRKTEVLWKSIAFVPLSARTFLHGCLKKNSRGASQKYLTLKMECSWFVWGVVC